MVKKATCPQCGKIMRWDRTMKAWDCGPEDEDGHGFWDPELQSLEYVITGPLAT